MHFNHSFLPPSPGNHFFSPTLRNAPVGAKILKFSTLKDEFLHHFKRVFYQSTGFLKIRNRAGKFRGFQSRGVARYFRNKKYRKLEQKGKFFIRARSARKIFTLGKFHDCGEAGKGLLGKKNEGVGIIN